jgi:hypothetical protein
MSPEYVEAATAMGPLPAEPYRGIRPFRFVDQRIFAARTEETWELLSNVTLYRAVLLYGASGTGKSSLINAGLLPQVLREEQVPERIRVQPLAGREFKIERIRLSDDDKAGYLRSNFVSESESKAESVELSLANFRARIESFRLHPNQADVEKSFADHAKDRPLLIFDQFEEFVTLFEEAGRGAADNENRGPGQQPKNTQSLILETLVELIQDDRLPVKLIFAFREDYLAKLSLLFDYCPELLDQAQRLTSPRIESLPQIIRAPFIDPSLRAHFLERPDEKGSELSQDLAERIGAELARRSEGGTANLTELQIVCQRLWQEPNPENLFEQKGISGLLEGYGADVFKQLAPETRDAAIALLSQMITASNTRNIISEEDLLARASECNATREQCTAALDALAGSQIVRRERRHDIYFYEITSEYLVPWIKERVTERKAIEAQQEAEQQRFEALMAESKQRRTRLLTKAVVLLGLLLIVSAGVAVYAVRESRRARQAELQATNARRDSEVVLGTLLSLVRSENSEENLKGIAELDQLIKDGKLPPDVASLVIQPALTSSDDRVREAANKVLKQNSQTSANVEQSFTRAAEVSDALAKQAPARFYIRITDESQRSQAKQVGAVLKQNGYLVPGIQKVASSSKENKLLSFRRNEPGMPKPEDIVALLKKATGSAWSSSYVPGHENSTAIRPGHFEILFASTDEVKGSDANEGTGKVVVKLMDENANSVTKPALITFREMTHFNKLMGMYPKPTTAIFRSVKSGDVLTVKAGLYVVNASPGYQPSTVEVSSGGTSTVELKLGKQRMIELEKEKTDPVRKPSPDLEKSPLQ